MYFILTIKYLKIDTGVAIHFHFYEIFTIHCTSPYRKLYFIQLISINLSEHPHDPPSASRCCTYSYSDKLTHFKNISPNYNDI